MTGKTYPDTVEVAFRQRSADGSVEADTVRLVLEDGTWGWFFGRDRAFVDAPPARFGSGF